MWLCKCECGNTGTIRSSSLASGNSKSCGCLNAEMCVRRPTTHGGTNLPEYKTYVDAKCRCRNANTPNFSLYGGRGIEFRFESFEEFYAELGEKPTRHHSIDRIDNNGHYEKGNVRWATRAEQSRNRRSSRLITINGKTQCVTDWGAEVGIQPSTIRARLKHGWPPDQAVLCPLRHVAAL